MPRYVSRPRSAVAEDDCVFDENPLLPAVSVDDHEAVFTGLLDATGDEIWRAPNPMGFGRDGDW
jgi:hypothetical protein